MVRLLLSSCFSTPELTRTGIGIAESTTMENHKKTVLTVGSTYLMKFMNTCLSSRSGAVLPPACIFSSSQAMFVAFLVKAIKQGLQQFGSPKIKEELTSTHFLR